MRTFAVVVGIIVVCALIGFGGFWFGNGGLDNRDDIAASITDRGDLEITSLRHRHIQVIAVVFNDQEYIDACASHPYPEFWMRDWNMNGRAGGWHLSNVPVQLREGDVVFALYNPRACGERIMKAEVVTDLGTYVFRSPSDRKVARPGRFAMKLDRWAYPQ